MRIGELARRARCPVETVRYYEREGLLPEPERSGSNYRIYREAQLERLTFIRNCRGLDMTLEEIRQLLVLRDQPGANCSRVNQLIEAHLGHVRARIASLQALEAQLSALRHSCSGQPQCEILHQLNQADRLAVKACCSHVDSCHTR